MVGNDDVPVENDWGMVADDDFDLRAAYRDFFGKTNAEMRSSFSKCVIEMADDLRWMPVVPFQYYVKGFADFVMSGAFHPIDAPDVASTFLGLVENKLQQQPRIIAPVMDHLLPVVEYVSRHQEDFFADPDIYGDFAEKGKLISSIWAAYEGKS